MVTEHGWMGLNGPPNMGLESTLKLRRINPCHLNMSSTTKGPIGNLPILSNKTTDIGVSS